VVAYYAGVLGGVSPAYLINIIFFQRTFPGPGNPSASLILSENLTHKVWFGVTYSSNTLRYDDTRVSTCWKPSSFSLINWELK